MSKSTDSIKSLSLFDGLLNYYTTEGLNLIPLIHGDKKPVSEWKEYQQRKITKEEINTFFLQGTQHNIGVVCGAISDNLYVLDFDTEEIFHRFFTKTDGLTVVKTGRGYHVYFKAESPVKTLKIFDSEGREIATLKGEGSYVVGPPSLHPSGAKYEFTQRDEIPRLTGDVRQQVKEHAIELGLTVPKDKIDLETLLKGVPAGNRDNSLMYLIHFLRRAGISKEDALRICEAWNKRNAPPLEDVSGKVDYHYELSDPYRYFYSLDPGLWNITEGLTLEKKKKSKAPKEAEKKKTLTVEEIKNLEDDNDKGIIANYVIYKKVFDGLPRHFTVKVHLEDGEIKEEVAPDVHSIPEQTAPGVNFCEAECDSLKEIFDEMKGIHQDYVAFEAGSIYPTLTALGSMASYFREAFYTYPYFDFISGEPETGKTTGMKTLIFTSFYGTVASSVSEALLFREIDSSHCFYGLDNIERLFTRPQDYAGIIDWLLSSYSRDIPCRRLAKVGDNFEVVSFDGYGEKAFTHITDFPVSLSTLKSRCIQIVMQKGRPIKFYPTPDKFAEIRDKMYHLRLREYQKVKEIYEALIISNVLKGRTGDLYYPLLAIAKLISEDVYKEVINYAKETERERTEVDEWNRELINLLHDEGIYGSISPKDFKLQYQNRLRDAGLLKEEKDIYTRTVTNKLKKLGFKRDKKKTENKTWFLINKNTVLQRAYEYGIVDTPPKTNLVTLTNSTSTQNKTNEEGAGDGSNKETRSGENEPNENEEEKKLTELDKLGNSEVSSKEKQKATIESQLVCVCGKRFDTLEVLQHHQANCRDFQAKQSKDARKRLEEEESLKINGK